MYDLDLDLTFYILSLADGTFILSIFLYFENPGLVPFDE
jgi:hypothetical protein